MTVYINTSNNFNHLHMYERNNLNGEISRSFLFLSFDLYVTREHKMTTFDSTGCGFLCLKKIWQNRLAPPKRWVALENVCVDRF